MSKRWVTFLFFVLLCLVQTIAQKISGRVTDASTGEPLPGVHVFFDDERSSGTTTNAEGRYTIAFRVGALNFSMVGFQSQVLQVAVPRTLNVRMKESAQTLQEVQVSKRKQRYRRKNNPAVEMMRKVIAAKKKSDLQQRDYVSFHKYQKYTLALNEVTEKVFQEDKFKHTPFLKDHVEVHPETGKLILPLSVDETVSRQIYRKTPKSEKSIIQGVRTHGLTELFNTGDILTGMVKDCFTDVDIYDNTVRLLQYPFISPISEHSAISFYRYFIVDTLKVGGDKCFQLDFTPNNPQDFGFSGTLYVLADSTWRVKRAELGIPHRSDVNFVEHMSIIQEYESLPSGEQVLVNDKMIVQLSLVDFLQKFQVERHTSYKDFSFAHIPDRAFQIKGQSSTDPGAWMRDEGYWEAHRPEKLTTSESTVDAFVKKLENIKGFKYVLFVAKAFIENFVETTLDPKKPSKVDIGPVNTTITHNFVEGLRLRASAQTTANLDSNWFAKGYVAHGFKDHKWKGMGEVTYSFNKKNYLPREFPVHNLSASYAYDVMSPCDRFVPTDKDNVFISLKWSKVDHMVYYERFNLLYDRELENGLRMTTSFRRERNTPAGALFFQPLSTAETPSTDAHLHRRDITYAEATFGLKYQPGATYVNTKQRRLTTNLDSPIYTLSHTVGLKDVVGGEYNYNFTEATVYKRFWLSSWGKVDCMLKGGVQWNKVPFPLLIMPATNLSYIMEDYTFNLIDNMEFLNDRYASLMVSWDLNGKLLNRIPLIRRLKWREYVGCNVLWGTLTDKNNPFLAENVGDSDLFYFPGNFERDGSFTYSSGIMDTKRPYVEWVAGIHNIFKLLHVEYVQRVNYLKPGTQRWGVRFMLRVTF